VWKTSFECDSCCDASRFASVLQNVLVMPRFKGLRGSPEVVKTDWRRDRGMPHGSWQTHPKSAQKGT